MTNVRDRIAKVETLSCSAGWRNYYYLKITTHDGVVGWSEYDEGFGNPGITNIIHQIAPRFIGEAVGDHERVHAILRGVTRPGTGGVIGQALGAIENALLDAKAKILGVPCAQLLASVLEREGYADLHTITDPTTALEAYVRLEPDLVLLDLMMPEVDGFQLLEAFKRHDRPDEFRPVLVLTADSTIAARRRALALGAKDFVSKPFDVIEIALRIANLLETRILYQRLRQS